MMPLETRYESSVLFWYKGYLEIWQIVCVLKLKPVSNTTSSMHLIL